LLKLRLPFTLSFLVVMVMIGGLINPFTEGFNPPTNRNDPSSAQAAGLEDTTIFFPVITFFPPENIYGVGMKSISTAGGLDALAQTHSSWVRKDGVRWNLVEPDEGQLNWDVLIPLNTELLAATRNHQRVVLVVQGTPDWAAQVADTTCGPIKEEYLDNFADFMHELVTRYSGYPYNIKYWEIWNEPDMDALNSIYGYGCWGNASDEFFGGGYYGKMLSHVYPAIKSADPQSRVLVGGLLLDCLPGVCETLQPPHSAKPPKFLEGILKEVGGSYFDGISFHAYDYYGGGSYGNMNWNSSQFTTGPVVSAKAAYIRGLLSKYGVTGKFLMNTESALICDNNCLSPFETVKANYLVQSYVVAAEQGFEANLWYTMLGWRNSELLDSTLNPRDAYKAFKFASEKLGGMVFSSNYEHNNLLVYEFRKGNRRILVMWSKDQFGYSHGLTPDKMYDALGSPIDVTNPINVTNIGPSPVYLEFTH
jgi:hypothetical protein